MTRFASTLLMLGALAGAAEQAAVLQDFEKPFQFGKWPADAKGEVVQSREWKADGQQSLRIDPGLMATLEGLALRNWSGYTHLRLRFKNTGDATTVGFELVDNNGSFHERHQNGFGVQPGESTVDFNFSGGLWRGEENRPYRGKIKTPIDITRIARISLLNNGNQPIFVDRIELIAVPPIACPGGFAFDFAKRGAQVMGQFIGIDQDRRYDASKGYGLLGAAQGPMIPAMSFPTPMLGTGFAWPQTGFQVDLAGGRYLGLIAFERGGFWDDEASGYRTMRLKVGDAVASEHGFSPSGPLFLFQDTEVADPAQIVDKLVWPAHAISSFDFTAAKGSNVFRIETDGAVGLPLRVAGLILAPDNADGRRFMQEHIDLQRKTFATVFAAKETGRRGEDRAAPDRDLLWQPMPAGSQMAPRDWPLKTAPPLPRLLAVPGQRLAIQLGVYARKPGAVAVTGTALSGAGTIGAPAISHGRYLPNRPFGTGTTWLEIHHFRPEANFNAGPELSRAVLVEYDLPIDAKPGEYAGTVTLKAGSCSTEVPIALTVVVADLPALPIPVGMFMNAIPANPGQLDDDAAWWRMQEGLLREQTRAGLTAVSGGPGLTFTFREGALVGAAAKRYLNLAKSLGVSAAVSYGGFLPACREFNGDYAALGASVKVLEQECGMPIYMNAYDEPGTDEEKRKVLDRLDRATKAGIRTIGFTSSHFGHELWERILQASYAPALNLHELADLKRVKDVGAHAWIYNNGSNRISFGIHLRRQIASGVEGRMEWIGMFVQGFAFNNLDGREPEPGKFHLHSTLGTLPTPGWVSAREGLLDTRIRLALEAAVPASDPALLAWPLAEGYRDDGQWPEARMAAARTTMLERLARAK